MSVIDHAGVFFPMLPFHAFSMALEYNLVSVGLWLQSRRDLEALNSDVLPSRDWFISSNRGNQAVGFTSMAAHPR
jgi:hypothetical protein